MQSTELYDYRMPTNFDRLASKVSFSLCLSFLSCYVFKECEIMSCLITLSLVSKFPLF